MAPMHPPNATPGGATAAIDLGGTHVRAAVVTADGTVVVHFRRSTPTDASRPDFLPTMIDEAVAAAGRPPIDAAVIGIPGVIDHDADAVLHAPNLPQGWLPLLTAHHLGEAIGVPVSLANDADLAAVGEAMFGAGRGRRDVVYVTISTGVGAGIVLDGRLVRGSRSGAEIGHTVIDAGAALAGRPATVEELGAGPAIAKAAADAGLVERDEALAELVRQGSPAATALWGRAIEAVGVGVTNLAWLIAPQVVVIGGGVGQNTDIVIPIIERCLADYGPSLEIDVVGAALGDDAALTGAAAWFAAVGREVS